MKKETEYFNKPLLEVSFDEVFKLPVLTMQKASLTPLEKCFLGLLITAIKPKTILEIGVWRGLTTKFLIEFCSENNISTNFIGFDLPEVIEDLNTNEYFKQMLSPIIFVKGILPKSLQDWLKCNEPVIDLAIVDADHNYFSAYTELCAVEPYIADDGYIFCHDYGQDAKNHEGVFYAVEDFCRKYQFSKLPLQSRPNAPKKLDSAQSVLLRRNMKTSFFKWLPHFKRYIRQRYLSDFETFVPYKLT